MCRPGRTRLFATPRRDVAFIILLLGQTCQNPCQNGRGLGGGVLFCFVLFLKCVLTESQTHRYVAALPTDFSASHAKRRWDGLFLCAGRVKCLNAVVGGFELVVSLLQSPCTLWDLEETRSQRAVQVSWDPSAAWQVLTSEGWGLAGSIAPREQNCWLSPALPSGKSLLSQRSGNQVVIPHSSHTRQGDLPCMVPRCARLLQGSVG